MGQVFVKDLSLESGRLKITFDTTSSVDKIFGIDYEFENESITFIVKTSPYPWRRIKNTIEVEYSADFVMFWKTVNCEKKKIEIAK